MKYISLLFIVIAVAACLSPSGDQSAPQVTVTLTATSIPTTTPIPTPTTHPQVMAIREQIAQSADFTLNADGQIEMQIPEGMTVVPDIKISPDGTMTFNYKGEEIVADPSTISIEGQIIKFADENGKEYRFTGEVIQERHDIEIRGTTYEGWLVEEESREVTEGKETWVNTSKVHTDRNFQQDTLTIPAGYLTNYKKVEIVGGEDESLNIIIFTLRYFYKNGETLDVQYASHNRVEKRISASELIQSDRPVFLEVSTPSTGSEYSSSIRNRSKELNGYSDFELDFILGGSGWIKSNELLAGLIYPQDNFWDLTDSVKVNSWTY